jgi:two-component system OmpR family response regulator
MRVLVVEDHPKTSALLERGLREDSYAVDVAHTGEEAVWFGSEVEYDIVVLDLMLPDIDGVEVLRRIRAAGSKAPVLVLTARDGIDDRVLGLDAGADDYLLKPFAFEELLARLRALTRRGPVERPTRIVVGDLEVDPTTRSVRRGDSDIRLTRKEFALLELLATNADSAVSRQQLLEHAWDSHFDGDSNVLDVFIRYLRQKIDVPFGCQSIETVRGYGYRLRTEQSHATHH